MFNDSFIAYILNWYVRLAVCINHVICAVIFLVWPIIFLVWPRFYTGVTCFILQRIQFRCIAHLAKRPTQPRFYKDWFAFWSFLSVIVKPGWELVCYYRCVLFAQSRSIWYLFSLSRVPSRFKFGINRFEEKGRTFQISYTSC